VCFYKMVVDFGTFSEDDRILLF